MEEITTPEPVITVPDNACINCGSSHVLEGYPNKLCQPCRESFLKLSIPLWVKAFGGGVLLLLLIALFEIPKNFSIALNLSKAIALEKQRNYFSEQHDLEKIVKEAPTMEVRSHLIIASFYNQDYKTFFEGTRELSGKRWEDTALVNQLNALQNRIITYFPTDSFSVVSKANKGIVPKPVFETYIKKYPGDVYARYAYAATLMDSSSTYKKCDALLTSVLADEPDYLGGLALKSIIKRELNQLDSSLYYCEKLLRINHQSVIALGSKARTTLKSGNKAGGLKMALQVYNMDKTNPYSMATLALAYHLNGNSGQRDELFAAASKDSSAMGSMEYVKNIVSGKQKF